MTIFYVFSVNIDAMDINSTSTVCSQVHPTSTKTSKTKGKRKKVASAFPIKVIYQKPLLIHLNVKYVGFLCVKTLNHVDFSVLIT